MSLADEIIENVASEYIFSKKEAHQVMELQRLSVEALYNQSIRLHCYAKGLEFALQLVKNKEPS